MGLLFALSVWFQFPFFTINVILLAQLSIMFVKYRFLERKKIVKSPMNKTFDRKEMDERQWYFSLNVAFQISRMNVLFLCEALKELCGHFSHLVFLETLFKSSKCSIEKPLWNADKVTLIILTPSCELLPVFWIYHSYVIRRYCLLHLVPVMHQFC